MSAGPSVEVWLAVLTPGMRRIVDVAVFGGQLAEVARTLGVSERYVARRISEAYGRLEVSGRPELIAMYWQHRLRDAEAA